jgi:hypothetical protein
VEAEHDDRQNARRLRQEERTHVTAGPDDLCLECHLPSFLHASVSVVARVVARGSPAIPGRHSQTTAPDDDEHTATPRVGAVAVTASVTRLGTRPAVPWRGASSSSCAIGMAPAIAITAAASLPPAQSAVMSGGEGHVEMTWVGVRGKQGERLIDAVATTTTLTVTSLQGGRRTSSSSSSSS